MTLLEAHKLALKVLKQVMEEKLDENNVQLAQVSQVIRGVADDRSRLLLVSRFSAHSSSRMSSSLSLRRYGRSMEDGTLDQCMT
jgi:hypothetical protein